MLPALTSASMGQQFERFFAAALLNNLPNPLVKISDQAWPGGTFSLNISRGDELVVSTAEDLLIGTIPLKVQFQGTVNQDLIFTQVNLDCSTQFETDSAVELQFSFITDSPDVSSKIHLPIPAVDVNCGEFTLPVQTLLQEVVNRQIPLWQSELDEAIELELKNLL